MSTSYEFQTSDDGEYELMAIDGSLMIEAARVRWLGDDLRGEITITTDKGITGPLEMTFMKPTSMNGVLGAVNGDDDHRQIVKDALDECCRKVVDAERTGSSTVVQLCDVPKPSPERDYQLAVLPALPQTSPAIWFGDGGTGKSLAALYAAGQLVKQGVRTLYLDWEWDEGEHRVRLEQLFGPNAMPRGLFYWRCDRPLGQIGDTVRRIVRHHRIEYVVIDSIGYACSSSPEAAEVAANYKRAVDRLGIGSLHVAHVPKNGNTSKPFGSVFWHNMARSTWYVEEVGTAKIRGAISTKELKWLHNKNNRGDREPQPRMMALRVDRAANTIQFAPQFISGKTPSTLDRVRQMLVSGPKLRAELRDLLTGVDPDTLQKAIKRGIDDRVLTESPDGRIALA